MPDFTSFIQIATDNKTLFALDDKGRVWKYIPAKIERSQITSGILEKITCYAFWTRLTDHRAGKKEK